MPCSRIAVRLERRRSPPKRPPGAPRRPGSLGSGLKSCSGNSGAWRAVWSSQSARRAPCARRESAWSGSSRRNVQSAGGYRRSWTPSGVRDFGRDYSGDDHSTGQGRTRKGENVEKQMTANDIEHALERLVEADRARSDATRAISDYQAERTEPQRPPCSRTSVPSLPFTASAKGTTSAY